MDLSCHFYADKTQLYISFKPKEEAVKANFLSLIENSLTDIEGWMRAVTLINEIHFFVKTEFIISNKT